MAAKQSDKVKPGTIDRLKKNRSDFVARRPHRSFRLTRRRDYVRGMAIGGYIDFTGKTVGFLYRHKSLFIRFTLVYALIIFLFGGVVSQTAYQSLRQTLAATGSGFGEIYQAFLLLGSSLFSSGGSSALADVQVVTVTLTSLIFWLAAVWLLRSLLSGGQPKLRDGLYNGGSPLVSSAAIFMLICLQLIPMAIGLIVLATAAQSGLYEIGAIAMLVSIAAVLLIVLSLYWVTSSIMALIIVTLPGMYPWQAVRSAGDLVVGRRLKLLLRWLWLLLTVVIIWAVIMIPTILLDGWLKDNSSIFDWLPLVPVALTITSGLALVWSSAYMYLLYRKVVSDESAPA